VKTGDLIWMCCTPGGICLFVGQRLDPHENELLYKVYHPTMGYTEMAYYYFDTLAEAIKIGLESN